MSCWKQGGFIMNLDIEKPNTAPASLGTSVVTCFSQETANLEYRVVPQFRALKDTEVLQLMMSVRFCT